MSAELIAVIASAVNPGLPPQRPDQGRADFRSLGHGRAAVSGRSGSKQPASLDEGRSMTSVTTTRTGADLSIANLEGVRR